ncbi:MAG: MFS transporter [Bacillota bacterium]|nr:MFS transporter [Bacillota bacterium]
MRGIFPIFFTVFLDLLGLGIIIPILPAVIMDPFGGILPLTCPYSIRIILYGFLIAAYPIAQFFGAPVLGTLADGYGRKRLLLLSLFGSLCGYCIFVTGIIEKSVSLLFLGRIVDGFTGGNISIAQAAIADISSEKTKARNFGLVGMAFGLGFVIGPYVGGKLSDPELVPWFNYATPFFLSIILIAINITLAAVNFPETIIKKRKSKISFFTGFVNIRRAFGFRELRIMFLVVFLLNLGHNFFTKFLQVFLMTKFNYSQSKIGDFYGYMGLWIAVSQGVILRPRSRRFSPSLILSVSTVMAAFALPLILVPKNPAWLYVVIPFVSILQGMNQPNTSAIISNQAGEEKQGEILGINQSMQSLSQAIPPIIGGLVTSLSLNLPTILSAALTISAWAVFVMFYLQKNKRPVKY